MTDPLVFVKLGGSILTDKTSAEALNSAVLASTVAAIARALAAHPDLRLVLGHGGGSYGHYWAARYQTHTGAYDANGWHGVALVSDAMGRLNRQIVAALIEAGVSAIGVQPSASARSSGRSLIELSTTALEQMLLPDRRLVPVVYGDVVQDDRQGAAIISTEAIFAYLAPRLRPQRIVLVGEAGVFTADPRHDPDAQRIPRIDATNIDAVLAQTGVSHGTDVTGGMATKVQQMWTLVQAAPNMSVQLIGADPALVERALLGQPIDQGTIITR